MQPCMMLCMCNVCGLAAQELLVPLVTDTDVKIDVAGFAALSLGLVFTSTCNGDAIEAIIQALIMRGELELSSPFAKFLALGLGLLFLGRQEAVEPTVEVLFTRAIISKVTACVSERPDGVQSAGPLLVWSYTLSGLLHIFAALQWFNALSRGNETACFSMLFAPQRSHRLQSLLTQLSIFANTAVDFSTHI